LFLTCCSCEPSFIKQRRSSVSNRASGGIVSLHQSWCRCGAIRANNSDGRISTSRYGVSFAGGTRLFSLGGEFEQHIVALGSTDPGPSNCAPAGSMVPADHHCSAALARMRSSNHLLICKIRSRSTPAYSHTRLRCVALEHGLGEADNVASY
jgi:hypothetical protein